MLYGLMKRSEVLTEKINKTEFGNHQTHYWNEAFKLKKVLSQNSNRYHFGHSLRTDGVQCSLLVYRLGEQKRQQSEKQGSKNRSVRLSARTRGLFFEKQVEQEPDYDSTELFGVDPGHKIMMQCYDRERDEYFRLTRREYLGRGMFTHQRRRIEEWKNQDSLPLNIEEALKLESNGLR